MRISSEGPVNCSSPNENGNGNIVHPEHITPSSALQLNSTTHTCSGLEDLMPKKKPVKYMECLKNHAAAIGGHATDGCGEFMPGGEEGSIEALKCSACNCHRNFHKKVIQGKYSPQALDHAEKEPTSGDQNHGLGPEKLGDCSNGTLIFSNSKVKKNQITMPSNQIETHTSETDEQELGGGFLRRQNGLGKKRYRTKFTQEQKEKMLSFAENVGWKIQAVDDCFVQQFCQEIGIKRKVLKVWMHNNKQGLAKKNSSTSF